MTFQDMYNNQDLFDDEDDDSDWEPAQEHVEIKKWFCTNCTMVNLDDIIHCDVCLCFMLLSRYSFCYYYYYNNYFW